MRNFYRHVIAFKKSVLPCLAILFAVSLSYYGAHHPESSLAIVGGMWEQHSTLMILVALASIVTAATIYITSLETQSNEGNTHDPM